MRQFWRLLALPGAHSCGRRGPGTGDKRSLSGPRSPIPGPVPKGYPMGVEPILSGSQPDVQKPLHYGHHAGMTNAQMTNDQ